MTILLWTCDFGTVEIGLDSSEAGFLAAKSSDPTFSSSKAMSFFVSSLRNILSFVDPLDEYHQGVALSI
jgi:hypothetical protein